MLTTELGLHPQLHADRRPRRRLVVKRLLRSLSSKSCLLGLLCFASIAFPLHLVRFGVLGLTAVFSFLGSRFDSAGLIGIAMQVILTCAVAALMFVGRRPDFAELKRKGIGRLEILAIALIVLYWTWMLLADFHAFAGMQAYEAWQALELRANWLYIIIRLAASVCFIAYLRLIGSFLYRPGVLIISHD